MARELERSRTPSSALSALVGNRSLLRTVQASAALGGATPTEDASEVKTLVVRGEEDRPASYEITVSEYIVPTPLPAPDAAPEPAGASVEDAVDDEGRRYVYTGKLMDVTVTGEATVNVDGRTVDPAAING